MAVQDALNFKIQKVPVRDMKPGPNVRKEAPSHEIAALAVSLKVQQLHPVVLAPDFMIIDGWRRWLAAAEAELEWLWAIVTNRQLSAEERIAAQLVMALHRKDLSEQEKVSACEELLASRPELDQKKLAAKLQVEPATICKWLSVSPDRVIPDVRDAFFNGAIGLKATYPISQAPKEHQAELLAMATAGATREQLTLQVRRQRKSEPDILASRIRCALPNGGSITVCGDSLSMDGVIDHLTNLLREAKRARQQRLDVKTWERVLVDLAKSAMVENESAS